MKKILIAEDNDSNYILLYSVLKLDYEILRAVNGKECVELYQTENPDLILMDLMMPIMNGFDTTRIIRKMDPNIGIIAVTAFSFQQDQDKALEAGCDLVVTKPINILNLKKVIKQRLEKK